jgi:sphingomyelin phosphodiesterase
MKKDFTFLTTWCLFLLFVAIATTNGQQQQQSVFTPPDVSIQNQVFELSNDLFETNSIEKSCSSCISLLHILKKMSYMSEGFLVNTLTRACKKLNKVDDEVCEGVIREQAPIIRKVLPVSCVSFISVIN